MSTSSDFKVWLITGCNAGLGLSLATIVAKAGHTVVGTVRSMSKFPASLQSLGVEPLELDITAPEATIVSAVQGIATKHGRIDVLINNAGFAHLGSSEEATDAESKYQFDVNVFGLLNFVRGVLPTMRAQKSGVIVNMSSIAGLIGGEGAALYVASKFAVEGLSESLKAELTRFNIRVHVVEPGYFRTNFLGVQGAGGSNLTRRISDYPDFNADFTDRHGVQSGDPEKGMQRVYELVTLTGYCKDHKDTLRMMLGPDSWGAAKMKADMFMAEVEKNKELAHTTDIEGSKPMGVFPPRDEES